MRRCCCQIVIRIHYNFTVSTPTKLVPRLFILPGITPLDRQQSTVFVGNDQLELKPAFQLLVQNYHAANYFLFYN